MGLSLTLLTLLDFIHVETSPSSYYLLLNAYFCIATSLATFKIVDVLAISHQ
ncbi:hypothetical protein HanXRQr2_Chr02g0057911 [Helianthus annuus]|uniref:Uncharacterized protein n=1 Tax=Helianthus annuus TaxID=4232 RepID=A0A9K3JNT3_HELAN|nr:hypothetical protein HanXRQr2_Chr02g0057911 [Helianthus annuus]